MAQVVIEFGSSRFSSVLEVMMFCIQHLTALEMEFRSGGGATFPATKEVVESIPRRFTDGEITSVIFRTNTEGVRYGLILEPHFNGQDLSLWMGTIELTTENWRNYWDRLLEFDGLAFVCVSAEEGVELNDQNLTVASFPWDVWPLLIAAVRGSAEKGSDWVIRERLEASGPVH